MKQEWVQLRDGTIVNLDYVRNIYVYRPDDEKVEYSLSMMIPQGADWTSLSIDITEKEYETLVRLINPTKLLT